MRLMVKKDTQIQRLMAHEDCGNSIELGGDRIGRRGGGMEVYGYGGGGRRRAVGGRAGGSLKIFGGSEKNNNGASASTSAKK